MKRSDNPNLPLATRARQLADKAGRGPRRAACLVAAVALAESSTVKGAHKILADPPPTIARPVIEAAHGILNQIESERNDHDPARKDAAA